MSKEKCEAFEQVVGFRVDLNIERVGCGPKDLMFDSVPRSDIMVSLTGSSETSATGAGKKITRCSVMFGLEPVSYDLRSLWSRTSQERPNSA